MKYIAEKGSVTLDGVSLTVASVGADSLTVSLIPHTLASTTLGFLRTGCPVNVEVDMLSRYVERLLEYRNVPDGRPESPDDQDKGHGGGLTLDFLRENGF